MKNKILAYGEIMLRLKATSGSIADSKSFEACYGGTEANVLACMSGLGHETSYLTALPATELGQAVLNHLHSFNVDTGNVVVRGDTLGMYFVEDGTASRGSNVLYLRKHSEFTRLSENDVDFDKLFANVALFHVSGISFALSDSSRRLAYRLLEEARRRKVKISFDFNYRAKLWSVDVAREQFVKAASYADILLASTLDLTTFLRVSEEEFFERYCCDYLIIRDRKVLSATEHSVKVKVLHRTARGVDSYIFPETVYPVTEKIGGGDAFDGCILHALMAEPCSLKDTTVFGVAGFMMKHQQKGDTFSATEREVATFAKGLEAKL
ncbi:MAG: sugar kinase [Clostridiales bacterium]|nr:sugar kinase [Clostridiales bacterium]